MSENKSYKFKNILSITVWVILGIGTVVLLVAAVNKKDSQRCKAVKINIKEVQNNYFIDRDDVNLMLEKMNLGKLKGQAINTFNLAAMEMNLEKNKWIRNAELFFDNNDVLRINIMEREPVARIFTSNGASFYIDTALAILPLSDKFSARLPVFTNFPGTDKKLSKADINLLLDVRNMSEYILLNPFWMAQIEQVDITPQRSFEMIPKIGNQVIIFGSAENYKEKFNNLLIFYKSVLRKVGWNKYAKINLTYKGQVIGLRRGAADIKMDSLKTIQLMKTLVANAQKHSMDSANNIQLAQYEDNSVPVSSPGDNKFSDELPTVNDVADTTFAKAPRGNNSNEKPKFGPFKERMATKPVIKYPAEKRKQKPKAVMQPKNEY